MFWLVIFYFIFFVTLQVDRHKYVKLAHHGFRALPREERLAVYNDGDGAREFDEPDFALIDTLFSLAEAHLFMQLVELKDGQPGCLPEGKQYADLYRDVRGAVDLCHRDGSIKREVAKHPERYIHADPGLVPLLDSLRQAGKTLFLATNSLWDYTSVVMNWWVAGFVGVIFFIFFCGCSCLVGWLFGLFVVCFPFAVLSREVLGFNATRGGFLCTALTLLCWWVAFPAVQADRRQEGRRPRRRLAVSV